MEDEVQLLKEKLNLLKEVSVEKIDVLNQLTALLYAGMYASSQRQLIDAADFYKQALSIFEKEKEEPQIANLLAKLGNVNLFEGKYADALDYYNRAIPIREKLKDGLGVADLHSNSATILGLPADTCHNFMAGYVVTAIANGCDGKKWIGTSVGLFTIDISAHHATPVQVVGLQQNHEINTLARDTACNMLVALQEDINLYLLNSTGAYIDTLKTNGIKNVNAESFSVKIYPQPSSNQINFIFGKEIANGTFVLSDITGRGLQQIYLDHTNRFSIDVSSFTNGIYFYQIYSGNKLFKTGKVEVVK